uniref:Uncharacterized protein n=1 Tax=Siphoviridae sp. ctX581 TaxID=2826365 RepID=A0A8S5MDE6_9CAUD|nr:MAG TPA: hypothetical protein [Siphoviridae sp. ctX581]
MTIYSYYDIIIYVRLRNNLTRKEQDNGKEKKQK